jgi:hypothetical protein
MWRSVLSVLAGMVLWTALWIPFNQGMQAAFPDLIDPARYLGHGPVLVTFIVASFLFSVAAGYLTAALARRRPVHHAAALGVAQLLLGIGFEVSYWTLLPVWYHVVFLALLIPGNLIGGMLRATIAAPETSGVG